MVISSKKISSECYSFYIFSFVGSFFVFIFVIIKKINYYMLELSSDDLKLLILIKKESGDMRSRLVQNFMKCS